MRKGLLFLVLLGAGTTAGAVAPGGGGCGWGNMLFEGESGVAPHVLAATTNGTSGNATFGMTSGTNGCDVSEPLTYGGDSLLTQRGVLEEVAHDMAVGHGPALTALAVAMGIDPEDRDYFKAVLHSHFDVIFPRPDVTARQVMQNIIAIMRTKEDLAAYVS